jgi:hypothetical protein
MRSRHVVAFAAALPLLCGRCPTGLLLLLLLPLGRVLRLTRSLWGACKYSSSISSRLKVFHVMLHNVLLL